MKIVSYEDDTLFSELRDEWDDLLHDSAADWIFLTHDWQSSWWQTYHPGSIWALALRDDGTGQLLGIAPWFVSTEGNGKRVIRTIGCVDVTDYVDVIARRGAEAAVFDALATYLAAHSDRFDEMQLCNVPQDSPTLSLMPEAFAEGFDVDIQLQEVCPVVNLPDEWLDYVASLDKKNRHELRRKLRRAGGNMAEVAWYIVGAEHDLEQELEQFLALMAASSAEKARFLEDEANVAFFYDMVPKMAAQGWLQLAFLMANDSLAATYLNFEYNNRVLVYNSGHNVEDFGHLSPGIVLLARLIEYAIENDREAFDFLRGDEPYKYDMGGQDTNVYQVHIRPT